MNLKNHGQSSETALCSLFLLIYLFKNSFLAKFWNEKFRVLKSKDRSISPCIVVRLTICCYGQGLMVIPFPGIEVIPKLKINKWCKPVRQSSFSFSLMSSLSPSTQIPETSWGFWDSLKDLLRRFLKRIIRYKTLNVIALGQTQTDYINQIIIVTYSSHK